MAFSRGFSQPQPTASSNIIQLGCERMGSTTFEVGREPIGRTQCSGAMAREESWKENSRLQGYRQDPCPPHRRRRARRTEIHTSQWIHVLVSQHNSRGVEAAPAEWAITLQQARDHSTAEYLLHPPVLGPYKRGSINPTTSTRLRVHAPIIGTLHITLTP